MDCGNLRIEEVHVRFTEMCCYSTPNSVGDDHDYQDNHDDHDDDNYNENGD